ncbi:hypothetical protein C8Q75DRAFT_723084 [Abortiporus biennis]|nr:hypothetical protein C8Q75DRAFT_723084 [Abortiporus biennis]
MYLTSPYPPVDPIPDENIHKLLFHFEQEDIEIEDKVIHIDGLTGFQRSRKEFYERVRDAATALGAPISEGGLGLSGDKEDIVAILSLNCLDYLVLANACFVITTPVAPLSGFSTLAELRHSLKVVSPTTIFVQPSSYADLLIVARELGIPENRIFVLEGEVPGCKNLEDLVNDVKRRKIARVPVRHATKDTLATLLFSSGTSGLPKAVMLSHGNFWSAMTAQIVVSMEDMQTLEAPPPPAVTLASMPLFHTAAFNTFIIMGIFANFTSVIIPKWDPLVAVRMVEKYKVTLLHTVASTLHQLVTLKGIEKANLTSIDTVTSGAAHVPHDLLVRLKKIIPQVSQAREIYGLTEATVAVIGIPAPGALDGRQTVPGSCGILRAGWEAKLLREDGSHADVDEPGMLWIRSPMVALGYYKNEKETKESFVDGWLCTGDIFSADKDGNFFFIDRAKDTLKVSGAQVSPSEIEETLFNHPDRLISDACVVGVPGGRTSDEKIPRAFVVLSEKGRLRGEIKTLAELNGWVQKNLSKYKWLRGGMEIVDEIPKTASGKSMRRILAAQYEARIPVATKM